MQTTNVAVCNIGLFDEKIRHFWAGNLNDFVIQYPIIKQPHKVDFYILIFVESAEGEIIIDQFKVHPKKSSVFVVKPNCITGIKLSENAKGKIFCFAEDFILNQEKSTIANQFTFLDRDSKPFIQLSQESYSKIGTIINLIVDEYISVHKESANVLRSYLYIVLTGIERNSLLIDKTILTSAKHLLIKEFEFQIDQHYETKKLPTEYAIILEVSPNYLNKTCKEIVGCTAGYLIRKRVQMEAQRLLQFTDSSVKDIASKLGFESTSYFITFFKKSTNLTPEKFRRNLFV